jgi:hypothetical protein
MQPAIPAAPAVRASRSALAFRIFILVLLLLAFFRSAPTLLRRSLHRERALVGPWARVRGAPALVYGGVAGGRRAAAAAAHPPPLPRAGYASRHEGLRALWEPRCQLPLEGPSAPHVIADICVSSEMHKRGRRDAIRAGYKRFAEEMGFRVRFFVGAPSGPDPHDLTSAESEQRLNGDLVMLPFRDSYENLTLKSLAMVVYASRCGAGDYFIKTDDDVFVFAWRLQQFLGEVELDLPMYKRALGVYIGTFWENAPPILAWDNKNFEDKWVLKELTVNGSMVLGGSHAKDPARMKRGTHFTPYAGGPFYILSRAAATWLADAARTINWRWRNEDMAMANMLVGGAWARFGARAGPVLCACAHRTPTPTPLFSSAPVVLFLLSRRSTSPRPLLRAQPT